MIPIFQQDLGNMNCTVFTHRQDYNRERNLQLVCEALNRGWGLDLSVNKHHDIISGYQLKVCVCITMATGTCFSFPCM